MRTFQWDRRDTIDAAGSTAVAERHNDASLALFAQLLQEPGNLIFSPLSIRAALGIVVEGARGETAVQMRTALRWPAAGTEEHVAFAKLIQRLNASGGRAYEMAVANSLWVQEGMALQPAFLELIATYHAGELHPIDFRREAASAYVEINRWVANKTKRRILELVPPGCLSADTDLVLANAVHFKGRWDLPFKRSATRREPFHVCGGGEVRAHLMHRKEECPYRRGRGFQAVDLRYVGGDLSMLVLLPDEKEGLRELESTLSNGMLEDCVENLSRREVDLFLPRFKLAWKSTAMEGQLSALGMSLAFMRNGADFSGINGCTPPHPESLSISFLVHEAIIEVNEEGTEAAAATTVGFERLLRPITQPVFRADHPFLYAIRERRSSAILFLGRVTDPTLEQ